MFFESPTAVRFANWSEWRSGFFRADSVGFAILANEYVDPTGSVDLER